MINNNGYTIERAIHGAEQGMCEPGAEKDDFGLTVAQAYNDIAVWNHSAMLEFFGAKNGRTSTHAIHTKKEFDEVAALPEIQHPSSIQVSPAFSLCHRVTRRIVFSD